jgi:hypothetical protein
MRIQVYTLLSAVFLALSCTPPSVPEEPETDRPVQENESVSTPDNPSKPEETMTIVITVGDSVFKAGIEDSDTGRAFVAKLPLTLDMSELNGNEKYCYGISLPRADKYFSSISAGDLMLYSGNCIVLFYGPAGGYSYTRIGKLQSTEGLASALGRGSVSVKFEKE